ncbi:MAG: cation transporter [Deltaproteobacteria bacterium]|nr:cation transporter [Deltaproteobacteria bacterium]
MRVGVDGSLGATTRQAATRRVVVIVLALNLGVAALKALYAAWSGSLAVGSDAVHSLTDGLSNVVGLVALRVAHRAPDERHPYGYQRAELLAAAGIGVIIAFSVIEFALGAVKGLLDDASPPTVTAEGIGLLVATLAANMVIAYYESRRGRALGSAFLLADAAHTRSDIFVTISVIGSQVAVALGLSWADPVAALFVVVAVFRIAWRILGENVGLLLDRAAIDAQAIEQVVTSIEEVVGCHRVRSRGSEGAVHLDLHLTLDGSLPLRRAHAIAHAAEDALRARFSSVVDVTIHIEPRDAPDETL